MNPRFERFAGSLRRFIPLGLSLLLLILTALKAFFDFDGNFDSIAYHLPFAALRVGLIDETHFRLTGVFQNYYDGFPALPYYIKGWLWRLLNKPEAVNLVSIGSFYCLILYVWRAFKVPFAWVVIGAASIPVVLVSLARNQLDLPANCFMAIVALSICDWYSRPSNFGKGKLLVALAAAFFAAHFKPQMVIHVAVSVLVVGVLLGNSVRRQSQLTAPIRVRPLQTIAVTGVALVLIFSEVLLNWVKHKNPFYPMQLTIGQLVVFPGPLTPWGLWPQPMYSAHYFQPLRWALSVFEFRAFDFRRIPYTVGNGDVPMDGMSAHAGGYMGLAVMFSLGLFFLLVWCKRDALAWSFCVALGLITIFSAIPPGSQEIRYSVYWMIVLVMANLIMFSTGNSTIAQYATSYKLFLLCELLYVCLITGGEHIIPDFRGIASYERVFHLDEHLRDFVHGGETICLTNNYQLAFLYAPVFHTDLAREHPYSVRVEHFTLGEKDFISPGSSICTWVP